MEHKIIEVHMSPAARAVIDQPDEDALAGIGPQIDDLAPHVFDVRVRWRVWMTLPVASSTTSTRVSCGSLPPPTRKLAQGCVTSKARRK